MKILLVEDDEVLLQIMKHRLCLSGEHEILSARNGKIAMRLAEKHRPEMIITDMLMPVASGAELIEYVRNTLILPAHIMAISTISLDSFRQEALEIGADCFIAKPFDLDILPEYVEEVNKIAQAS